MKYRKNPVLIEAYQPYDGEIPEWFEAALKSGSISECVLGGFNIKTLEGVMHASPGDFIIKGVKGEFYPCKPDIFVATYEKEPEFMSFGEAIGAMKAGLRVARKGWNGKGMFVVYQKAYPDGIPCNEQTAQAWGMKQGDLFCCEPYLQIKMVNGSHAMWVPSINDVLAEDWVIVNG